MWDLVAEASEGWQEVVGRETERLAPLTRVWYFLFLFYEAQFFMETCRFAHGHSVCTLWCHSLCHEVESQGEPSMAPPSVPSLPAHCSPSSLNLLPFCHCCLPSTPSSFHSEPYCVPLSHTLPPSLTRSFTAQCIRQNTQALQAV